MKLITYQSPNGQRVYLCRRHKDVVTRDSHGAEHCTVHRGLTNIRDGRCLVCAKAR